MTKIYSEREREDIHRRAEEKLVRAGRKLPPRKKTISAYVDDQRMAHNKESLAKAKKMIARWKREKASADVKATSKAKVEKLRRQKEQVAALKEARDLRDFQRFEWQDDQHFVTWRGQKIPKTRWDV